MTLAAFESIAAATAMPVVARELDALSGYTWAFNAYIVASLLAMAFPIAYLHCQLDQLKKSQMSATAPNGFRSMSGVTAS